MKIRLLTIILLTLTMQAAIALPPDAPAAENRSITLTITDKDKKPVKKAQVTCISEKRTPMGAAEIDITTSRTNNEGKVVFRPISEKPCTIYIAHPDHPAAMEANVKLKDGMTAALMPQPKNARGETVAVGSVIFPNGPGTIPGLEGSVEPVLDASGRYYIYGKNISIAGGQRQPVSFVLGKPFLMEDANGARFAVAILAVKVKTSLIQYEKLPAAVAKK